MKLSGSLDTVEMKRETQKKDCKFSCSFLCELCSCKIIQFKENYIFPLESIAKNVSISFFLQSLQCLQVQRKQQSGQIRCLLEVSSLISASNWSCFFHEKCFIMKENWKAGDSPSHTYAVFDWDSAPIVLIMLNQGLTAGAEWTREMFMAIISIASFMLLPTAASSNHCLCGYRKISV